jgi:nicotinate phosphoribosyltransferase
MPPAHGDSTALLTDQYELTMLASALAGGSASRRCRFEVFTRGLRGHRYGIVAGVPRLLDAVARFRFGDEQLAPVASPRQWCWRH